jgi:hypothetical protein
MRIRPATTADLAAIVCFSAGLFAEDSGTRDPFGDPTWPAREGAAYYGAALDDDRVRICLAEDTESRGYLLGRLRPPNPTRGGAVLADLESMFLVPRAPVDRHREAARGGVRGVGAGGGGGCARRVGLRLQRRPLGPTAGPAVKLRTQYA